MASSLYGKYKEAILTAGLNLTTLDIKAVLVDSADYTPNLATDQYLSSIAAGGRVATSGNLASKTVALGVFDAADITITGVTGDQFEYIVLYHDTGNAATSELIALIDTATGLPCTPNSGDITITWDNGASKIFAL